MGTEAKTMQILTDLELEDLRRRLEARLSVKIRPGRIRALRVNSAHHWQPPLWIEVGGLCSDLEKDGPPERILAIFEHASFLVVTPDHGLEDDTLPYLFSRPDVREVVPWA